MVKSTSTADKRCRVRHLALGLALVFLVPVLLCALTSCSLGSMPTKSSSVSGDSVSDGLASGSSFSADSDLSGDDGEDPADPSDPSSIMRNIAEGYMTVLQEGNIDATAELFKMRDAELLPTTYDCDETIYHALWANMTYLYGAVSTSDYVDYKLDVTCEIPDFRGCVNMIIEDETAMSYLTKDWILSMGDPQAEVEAYAKMWNSILLAAAETIEQGAYTDKVMYTDSFSFHDNKDGNWICMRTPDFVRLCGRDNYMVGLSYLDPISIYMLVEEYGGKLVEQGVLTKTAYDAALEKKKEAVVNAG